MPSGLRSIDSMTNGAHHDFIRSRQPVAKGEFLSNTRSPKPQAALDGSEAGTQACIGRRLFAFMALQ
jgi:hypothetical protein